MLKELHECLVAAVADIIIPLKIEMTMLRAHSTGIPNPSRTLIYLGHHLNSPLSAINSIGTCEGPCAFSFHLMSAPLRLCIHSLLNLP